MIHFPVVIRIPVKYGSINFQGQLSLFLENYSILIPKENDQVYLWQYNGVEHKLTKDTFNRLVESIVDEWISNGAKDITDFQNKLGIKVVRLVQRLGI